MLYKDLKTISPINFVNINNLGARFMRNIGKLFAIGILMLFLFATVTSGLGTNYDPEDHILLDFNFYSLRIYLNIPF